MHKKLMIPLLSIISFATFAQSEGIVQSEIKSEATYKVSAPGKNKRCKYFPASAPVTMADGSIRAMADVKVGEHVKTCRNGKSIVTQVKQVDVYNHPNAQLTAVYLRPVNETTASSKDGSHVPALLLEATPYHHVQTNKGRKRMKQLSKNDVLYHYEPATGKVSNWVVGAIQLNARKIRKAYNLQTEDGTYLVENMMVANN